MATKKDYPEKGIQQFLKCSICLSPINKPKMLPCIHTFCEKCLDALITASGKQGKLHCPLCQREVNIPQEGAAGIQSNFFVQSLREAFPLDSKTLCDVCVKVRHETTMATSICVQCVESLCPICSDGHTKYSTRTMGHKVVALGDVRSGRFLKEIQEHQLSFYRKHKDENLKLFCLSCRKAICILCKTLDHDDHKVTSLEDAANKVSDHLKALSKPVSAKISIVRKISEEKIHLKEMVHTESEVRQKQVKEWSKREIEKIQNTETKLLEELKQSENILIKEACTAAEEAESLLATFQSSVEYTQSVTEHANNTVMLQQYQELNSRLEELNQIDIPAPTRSMTPGFAFVPTNLPMILAEIKIADQTLVLHHGKLVSSFSVKRYGEKEPRCADITVDGTTVYTTDHNNKKVKAFNKTGKYQCLVGKGKIDHPIGITTDKQGRLILTDKTKRRLIVFKVNREHTLTVEDLYGEYGCVGTNSKNEIIITDNINKKLSVLEPNGNVCRSIEGNCVLGADTFTPHYIATNMNDDMIVSDKESKCVHILDATTGSRLHVYKTGGIPEGVCVDKWGNILVVDNTAGCSKETARGRVHLVSSTGEHLAFVITENDGLKYSTGICICGPGEFAVLEWKGCVKRYTYLDI